MNPKQKNQHIKVFARVRPRNTQEQRSHVVVECNGQKEITVKDKGQTKNFSFDRVFGPESKQVEVYKAVVAPLITEVLQGYNCTVFAYGQTGTGKTFTMVGDRTKEQAGGWQNDPLSGIVPRTLDHLFDELKVRAEEFTVRISFLELYNEELCDLLAPLDNDDTKTLRLFEDSMKKGSVIVSGLEERTVYEKNDVYPILEAGSLRRQTAPTLMNASSSRSHTIFTITVHVKVTTPEGEDLFKTGKLNLVDLAGSENIGRSGAVDMRAREAGNINQSLLTLGRVITSLVERTPHVPYRESKLTRILQDSLGGRTKTSIIATVSPALCNLEETLSTFDYAHRARNITNKPEINQKMSKHVLLKNYTDEIERLRRELMAAREKSGVYLLNEDYHGMVSQIDNLNKDLVSKIQLLKVREEELVKQEEIMASLNMNLYDAQNDLAMKEEILRAKEEALKERERAFHELKNQATVLLKTADEATEDSKKLHDRLERARMVHCHNEELVDSFKSRFVSDLQAMKQTTQAFQSRGSELAEMLLSMHSERSSGCEQHDRDVITTVEQFLQNLGSLLPDLCSRLTAQLENAMPTLGKNTVEMSKIGADLGILGDMLTTTLVKWLESCDPAWENITSKVNSSVSILENVAASLEEAQNRVQKSAEDFQHLPEQLEAAVQEEEKVIADMKEKDSALSKEMDAIRLEEEALMERFKQARKTQMEVEAAIAEQEGKVKLAREKAAKATALSSQTRMSELLDVLKQTADLNAAAQQNAVEAIPSVRTVKENLISQTANLKEMFTEHLSQKQVKCAEISDMQKHEISALSDVLVVSIKAQEDVSAASQAFKQSTKALLDGEAQRLADSDKATVTAYKNLANELSDFCDQTFANIHDRVTELKQHKEQYRKDEKTGFTPQRKEFQYPKRLVSTAGTLNESKENIAPTLLSNSYNDSSLGTTVVSAKATMERSFKKKR